MKKTTLLMVLSMILAVALGVGSTMAYLQDTDEDVNVMTLGNVYITQNEQERVDAEKLPTEDNLKEFEQKKDLYPAVFEGSSIPYDADSYAQNDDWKVTEYNENVVDKFVTVTNTGKSDAYVRTIVAYEGDDTHGPEGAFIHVVHNGDNAKLTTPIDVELVGNVTIDEVEYTAYVYTYAEALAPGETSIPSLKQVYMNKNAGNKEMEYYGEEYDICVLSQAVQTQGFADANTALNTAFGEINQDNVQEWFANIGKNIGTPGEDWISNNPPSFVPEDANTIANVDELNAALTDGGEYYLIESLTLADKPVVIKNGASITINLNGKTISTSSTSSTTSYGIEVQAGATLELKGEGLVTFYATKPDTEWGGEGQPAFPGYANNTIKNLGKLIIDGPTVENKTAAGGASYAIDCYQGSELIIESGKIMGYDKCAIRMFANSNTQTTSVTVNGGEISGKRGIWIQLPGSNASNVRPVNLTVTGGTITSLQPDKDCAIYSYSYGDSFANTNITISGGTFNGDVAFGGGYKGDQENVTVTGGTFNGYLGRYLANDGWEDIAKP